MDRGSVSVGEPFFFGANSSNFGNFHAVARPAGEAVVLLYPVGHEYVRSHRAFRNLSLSLAAAGRPVLRFDYTSTGDSRGDSAGLSLATLLDDVAAAIDECARRAGTRRVVLVGLRLGAALAFLAASRREDITRVVAWDPVVSGRAYLDELAALQTGWLRDRLGANSAVAASDDELLGLQVSRTLVGELQTIDLTSDPSRGAFRVDILESIPREDTAAWRRHLQAQGVRVEYEHLPSAGDWDNPEAVHQLLLPHEILRRIGSLLTAG